MHIPIKVNLLVHFYSFLLKIGRFFDKNIYFSKYKVKMNSLYAKISQKLPLLGADTTKTSISFTLNGWRTFKELMANSYIAIF
ncbi:hypothetical protein JN06_02081 [Bacteroides zoogleoformans]|uniref:Transposase n=1 Tax=Bacteroides zoogleoformans TaxID=28119 RepID=A0ABN5IJH7_9BACE|nr:hypothetical protein C4H11_08945 [Bacteroides zoogleoformans]TWJ13137.1 hypothetical protein JN06_02081 [Bacteroides zoogleoformans]